MTTTRPVQLAAVHYETGFPIDDFMMRLGELLRADGIRIGGAIQHNAAGAPDHCSAMALVDLSSGARMKISQDLGSQARGCRLDSGRLAEFGTLLGGKPERDAGLLIFNKFGKSESEGQGLLRNLVQAIESGLAVITAVRPPYDQAWRAFHEGLAVALPPDLDVARRWCHAAVAPSQTASAGTPALPLQGPGR